MLQPTFEDLRAIDELMQSRGWKRIQAILGEEIEQDRERLVSADLEDVPRLQQRIKNTRRVLALPGEKLKEWGKTLKEEQK